MTSMERVARLGTASRSVRCRCRPPSERGASSSRPGGAAPGRQNQASCRPRASSHRVARVEDGGGARCHRHCGGGRPRTAAGPAASDRDWPGAAHDAGPKFAFGTEGQPFNGPGWVLLSAGRPTRRQAATVGPGAMRRQDGRRPGCRSREERRDGEGHRRPRRARSASSLAPSTRHNAALGLMREAAASDHHGAVRTSGSLQDSPTGTRRSRPPARSFANRSCRMGATAVGVGARTPQGSHHVHNKVLSSGSGHPPEIGLGGGESPATPCSSPATQQVARSLMSSGSEAKHAIVGVGPSASGEVPACTTQLTT